MAISISHGPALLAIFLVGACSGYPRDMGGTLKHIKTSHEIRVGVIADAMPQASLTVAQNLLSKLSVATDAHPKIHTASAEQLFAELDAGEVDLVLGEIATDSPWITDVNVLEPLSERTIAKRKFGFGAITRNGENAWTMLLERTQRDMAATS